MAASLDELEQRLSHLRTELRGAVRARDKAETARIRRELREAEVAWEHALESEAGADDEALPTGPPAPQVSAPTGAPRRKERPTHGSIPIREQVHQALTLLGAPASPKLISSTYEAFFTQPLVATKLASLRRDEERSFTAQGYARPYYICAALTHDRLVPARGLLALSTWPVERRIIGPLSPRADFLTHAVGTAEQIQRLTAAGHPAPEAAWRLLRRFALTIPGAHDTAAPDPDPARVIAAAHAEAAVHQQEDNQQRQAAAQRARAQLADVQQLFGAAPMRDALRDASGTLS
ncbi:predicted protein [Streptomyces viridosporus ATCC 14672]|uniref:Predicted protein n=1 Tax=Streptomyces viridosporus (strain ATCC 14672 / DSM 40746 / JCM 4963 / KCTC 9882 / NRRL B-12104 / FH 1290) TaxID=566461 RepID=D6A6Q8_STRV1|nr:hypothetical protein [Streptomyces viridosporus]EFE69833.1 predicted protein [Streptomyces viridosporus ATCC 14672]